MKLSNKIINYLFKSKLISFLTRRFIRRLIKKNKFFFIDTNLEKLPEINYPFLLSLKDLQEKKNFYFKNQFTVPTNEFPYLSLVLKLIFDKDKEFKFLDFGAQYIDNYFFLKNKNENINYHYHDLIENNKIVEKFLNINKLENIKVMNNLDDIKKNSI